jgi:hypothetical protein
MLVITHKYLLTNENLHHKLQYNRIFLNKNIKNYFEKHALIEHRWASASRKLTPTSAVHGIRHLSPVPDKKMSDCAALFRYRTGSGIANFFSPVRD